MKNNLTHQQLFKGAVINGAISGTINGMTNWFQIDKSKNHFLTVDSISANEQTVLSGAVVLAVTLAFILSSIAYFTLKNIEKPPYFPKIFLLAIKHSMYAFGLVALAGLLLQRYAGSIEVKPAVASMVAGITAFFVATMVDFETKKNLLETSEKRLSSVK